MTEAVGGHQPRHAGDACSPETYRVYSVFTVFLDP